MSRQAVLITHFAEVFDRLVIRPRLLPVLPPPVPLWAPNTRTVLLLRSFVLASPVEARLTHLEPLLAALGELSIAAGSVRTLIGALAFLQLTGVILNVTWIFVFHSSSLMSCSSSSFLFPLLGDDDSELLEDVWLSEHDELLLDLLFLSFFEFFQDRHDSPNRFVGWHSLRCLLLKQFPTALLDLAVTRKIVGPILVDNLHSWV